MTTITSKSLQSITPKAEPYFIRDDKVKGFAAKVNPSGSIKLIAEVRHEGRTVRKTIGQHPHIVISDARKQAITFIQQVRAGQLKKPVTTTTLETLFDNYIRGDRLKPSTLKSYKEVIFFYLSDWLEKPVASITKQMVEKRFYQIRDKGIAGGIPTYSQATKKSGIQRIRGLTMSRSLLRFRECLIGRRTGVGMSFPLPRRKVLVSAT